MPFDPSFLLPEFTSKTSRSGGKGGQNVNKVSTKVLLEFSVTESRLLTSGQKDTIMDKLAAKITEEGLLQVVSQASRSQLENKETAVKKVFALLSSAFRIRKKRKATKPTRSSVEKRLTSKKKTSAIKVSRRSKGD